MDTFHIKSILQRLRPGRRSESMTVQYGRDARADWQLVFIIFFVLNLISFVANIFVYAEINKGEIFQTPQQSISSVHQISRAELRDAIDFFDTKKERFEMLQSMPLSIASPGPAIEKKK